MTRSFTNCGENEELIKPDGTHLRPEFFLKLSIIKMGPVSHHLNPKNLKTDSIQHEMLKENLKSINPQYHDPTEAHKVN